MSNASSCGVKVKRTPGLRCTIASLSGRPASLPGSTASYEDSTSSKALPKLSSWLGSDGRLVENFRGHVTGARSQPKRCDGRTDASASCHYVNEEEEEEEGGAGLGDDG